MAHAEWDLSFVSLGQLHESWSFALGVQVEKLEVTLLFWLWLQRSTCLSAQIPSFLFLGTGEELAEEAGLRRHGQFEGEASEFGEGVAQGPFQESGSEGVELIDQIEAKEETREAEQEEKE